jgi:hypothetical protein
MARRTNVREHVRRTERGFTEVREHERSIEQVDRRDRIVDAIRVEAARRRRFEEYCINNALAEYADLRSDGESHEEAMRRALDTLILELESGAEYRFDEADVLRVKAELEALVVKSNARGYKEAASRARNAPAAAKRDSAADADEERMMSIHDALSDEDQSFSFADVLDDEDEKDDRYKGGRQRRSEPLPSRERDDSILGSASSGLNELGDGIQRYRGRRSAAAMRPNRTDLVQSETATRAAERRRAQRDDETGVQKQYDRDMLGAPPGTGVSVRKRGRPTVWSGTVDDIPEVPRKGTGRLDE